MYGEIHAEVHQVIHVARREAGRVDHGQVMVRHVPADGAAGENRIGPADEFRPVAPIVIHPSALLVFLNNQPDPRWRGGRDERVDRWNKICPAVWRWILATLRTIREANWAGARNALRDAGADDGGRITGLEYRHVNRGSVRAEGHRFRSVSVDHQVAHHLKCGRVEYLYGVRLGA